MSKSRFIQAYGFLGLIPLVGLSGTQTIMGSPGITPGYDLLGSIVSYTFLHIDPVHLWGNVMILAPLMALFALIERQPLIILATLVAVSGVIIWLIEIQVGMGASALYCALIPYIVIRGFALKSAPGIAVAIATAAFFFKIFIDSVIPSAAYGTNYGHIGGAIGGILVAIGMTMAGRRS